MTIRNVNPSGTTTTTVSFKYTDKGLLKKFDGGDYYYGTYKYDGKKLKSSEVQRGDGVPEKCKYTWKNGRVSKVVRTMAANSNYKVITTIKYKKISVPSTYLKLVKKQRNHILMDHAYQTRVSNFPLGRL